MLLYILYYILPISSSRYVICASLQLPSNPEIKKAFLRPPLIKHIASYFYFLVTDPTRAIKDVLT